jgi:hypothetical protein
MITRRSVIARLRAAGIVDSTLRSSATATTDEGTAREGCFAIFSLLILHPSSPRNSNSPDHRIISF